MPFYQKQFVGEREPVPEISRTEIAQNPAEGEETEFTETQILSESGDNPENKIAAETSAEEKELVISTETYFLTLSNRGGGTITQFCFKEYQNFRGNRVHLLKPGPVEIWGWNFPYPTRKPFHLMISLSTRPSLNGILTWTPFMLTGP